MGTSSQPSRSSLPFRSLRFPIERPASDIEALHKLRECSADTLRRTRKRHHRALETLQDGGYDALSVPTRQRLIARLERDLNLLDRALNPPEASSTDCDTATEASSSGLWSYLSRLW